MRSIITIFGALALLSGCGGGSSDSGVSEVQASPQSVEILHTVSAVPLTTAIEDQPYEFSVTVNNPDGDPLRFNLVNAPAWMSIDNLGVVSGVAQTDTDTGRFENIKVRVSDNKQNVVELAPFNLDVSPVNDVPNVQFEYGQYSFVGRDTTTIQFDFIDEESSTPDFAQVSSSPSKAFSVELGVGNTLEITTADIEAVTQEIVQIEFFDGVNVISKSLELTAYPVNESGYGRTIRGSRSGSGVHVVVLGDGYRASDAALFARDVMTFNALFESDPYIASHMSAWNIHMVFTVSEEAGSDDFYGVDSKSTVFDSGYNCSDIERLICANKTKIFEVVSREYPSFDQAVLIVNSDAYGGSGEKSLAIYNSSNPELALHELGHSFANLADEYVDESIAAAYTDLYTQGQYANISNSNDISEAPWAHWIGNMSSETSDNVGLYEGAFYNEKGFFRPTFDSVMRTPSAPFGVVNAEQWILSIYSTAEAVTDVFPQNTEVTVGANNGVSFSVTPLYGAPIQEIRWLIDGIEISDTLNTTSIELDLPVGAYTVTAQVRDVSGKVRNPAEDISSNFTFQWQLSVE